MATIAIIGLGLSCKDLTEHHLSMIRRADVLAGGKRHLGYFPDFSGQTLDISKDLKGLGEQLKQLQASGKQIVVLASGDPLYFGIGAYLSTALGRDNVAVYPNINAVAGAFSRITMSWHDAAVLSFHGRKIDGTHLEKFKTHDKLAVMTDKENTPTRLFCWMSTNGIRGFRVCVLEHLGMNTERVQWFEPGQVVEGDFRDPNIMILIRSSEGPEHPPPAIYPGMPSHMFQHENGLITKSEIRSVTLSKLRLEHNSILWDLGAGSGSVSIEASLYIRTGRIFAVEKNASRVDDIRENQKKFQVMNMDVCHGKLPMAMDSLPDPDRIFIGGGGKDLVAIIENAADRLSSRGIVVINTVLLKNMAVSLDVLEQLGFETQITQIQVNSDHRMPRDRMLRGGNPVWIIQGNRF